MASCHTDGGSEKKILAGTFAIKISPGPDNGIRIRLFLLIHAKQHANHSQTKLFSINARMRMERGREEFHSEENLSKRRWAARY